MQKLMTELYPHENQIIQDAYDALIANLYSIEKVPKTICITGGSPGIGKTTIAINLSIAMALAGRKVLMIDTDIRKATEMKRLSADNMLGLSDYLTGDVNLDDVITATNHENLFLILCGDASSSNPLGLLYSPKFDYLLEKVAERFDFTLFDTSALDANADASVVATKTDATLMVVTPDEHTKVLQKDLKKLRELGANVVATVLNKVPKSEYKKHLAFYNAKRPIDVKATQRRQS